MPETKIFLDTNIIIYAYDVSAKEKHEQARKLLVDLWDSGRGVLSTQVLQEFFVSVTQKIPQPLTLNMAKDIVSDLLRWEMVVNDGDSILEAIELRSRHKYSFWDSLIIQAAIKGGASLLLSEDLSGGQTIQGVAIRNPFKSPLPRFSEG
jgi:predicted nucleic acid-binding protein